MKKTFTILFTFLFLLSYSQDEEIYDYNDQLSVVSGIQLIDGSKINPNERFANLSTDNMIFTDRSSITFVNCLVKVFGTFDARANCKIKLINSYVICRNFKGNEKRPDNVIESEYIENCRISEVPYLRKIKGNPELQIINKAGKIVLKGKKEAIKHKIIYTGVYDIRSTGNFYESDVLLTSN